LCSLNTFWTDSKNDSNSSSEIENWVIYCVLELWFAAFLFTLQTRSRQIARVLNGIKMHSRTDSSSTGVNLNRSQLLILQSNSGTVQVLILGYGFCIKLKPFSKVNVKFQFWVGQGYVPKMSLHSLTWNHSRTEIWEPVRFIIITNFLSWILDA
jgi:hypothetical protein